MRMCVPRKVSAGLVAVFMVASLGCGAKAPPGTLWISGNVNHEDDRLVKGVVHFVPKNGSPAGGGGAARIEDGRFGLYLMPGHYEMAVVSRDGVEDIDPKTGRLLPPPSRIPIRFETVKTSGLEATVDPDQRRIDIQLGP